ncbi:MAG TPA: HAMP domain-containing sensor histidine kinase [Chitinophagaceae bacterium]|jgi:signal transduction histidine kinase|nr:HAMP domain-containing sensor histidine kinase [Chitinophagaceae bacterium]
MEFLQLQNRLLRIFKSVEIFETGRSIQKRSFDFLEHVKSIGCIPSLDDFEQRKLRIFNQLNFFQLVTGVIAPVMAILSSVKFPIEAWYITTSPALISILVLVLNANYKYHAALLCYFIFYPVFTCVIYINGFNLGIELSFILYGILAVFFLQDIGYMLFAVGLSMISYFILSITWKQYRYQLEMHNYIAYLINQVLAIIYIFYGLYLTKREITEYQFSVVSKNRQLHKKNLEIEDQQKEILTKAKLLERRAAELRQSNAVKNKLFSVISHDLKAPMYALRNFFESARQMNLPAKEIKAMLPDVVKDLNYTTGLMENLLQWAKFQMQSDVIQPQNLDISDEVNQIVRLLRLQSDAKKISVETKTSLPAHAWADKNIIDLVLRNLLTNAIKFTPERGRIVIGTYESANCVEVYVQDTGRGISKEEMAKINKNIFFTTNGTHNEGGTGLGLMLCKEFLAKIEGRLIVESEPSVGSTFSFTLPLAK